jgi:hypothetical protein
VENISKNFYFPIITCLALPDIVLVEAKAVNEQMLLHFHIGDATR